MKIKKRNYIWVSLLLAGTLCCLPEGRMDVWAGGEEGALQEEGIDEDDPIEREETVSEDTVSEDIVSSQMGRGTETLSENGSGSQSSVSDDSVSSDGIYYGGISGDGAVNEEVYKQVTNVVLPTDIPFKMVLFGEERLEGLIRSERFFIENRGYEDVRISFRGICKGENEEEYIVGDTSTEEKMVEGKKNAWVYLKWESEGHEDLEQREITMGDISAPGKGEIVLKAPTRNKKGEIIEKVDGSKAYFSFWGDFRSDTGEAWEDGELNLDIDYTVEVVEQPKDLTDVENDEYMGDDSKDEGEVEDIELQKSVSDNVDEGSVLVDDGEKIVSSNEEGAFFQVSGNEVDMLQEVDDPKISDDTDVEEDMKKNEKKAKEIDHPSDNSIER